MMNEKWSCLVEYFKTFESAAVAFSGGVDSTFLLKAAKEALGDQVVAVTVVLNSFPEREREEARAFCKKEQITQIEYSMNELEIEGFSANPKNRCYLCKKALFTQMMKLTEERGIEILVEGSNLDDEGDYRPGMAAISELGIRSPLREVGFTKTEIRAISEQLGLSTWRKPSFACLSSRFVYGETITREKLKMVEKAEEFLHDHGFIQIRVRTHGMMARIEAMPEDFLKLVQMHEMINKKLKELGFTYVSMDLEGYRTGSMNIFS